MILQIVKKSDEAVTLGLNLGLWLFLGKEGVESEHLKVSYFFLNGIQVDIFLEQLESLLHLLSDLRVLNTLLDSGGEIQFGLGLEEILVFHHGAGADDEVLAFGKVLFGRVREDHSGQERNFLAVFH